MMYIHYENGARLPSAEEYREIVNVVQAWAGSTPCWQKTWTMAHVFDDAVLTTRGWYMDMPLVAQ